MQHVAKKLIFMALSVSGSELLCILKCLFSLPFVFYLLFLKLIIFCFVSGICASISHATVV